MKNQCKFRIGKKNTIKCLKKLILECLGLHLGRVWDGLGRLLGTFGRFLAVLWGVKINLFSNMGLRWGPRSLLNRFWKVLGGFGKDFGGKGAGFWKIFHLFQQVLGRLWTSLKRFGLAAADSLNRTPALIREASQCAGVLDLSAC